MAPHHAAEFCTELPELARPGPAEPSLARLDQSGGTKLSRAAQSPALPGPARPARPSPPRPSPARADNTMNKVLTPGLTGPPRQAVGADFSFDHQFKPWIGKFRRQSIGDLRFETRGGHGRADDGDFGGKRAREKG